MTGGRYGVEGKITTVLSVAIENGPLMTITSENGNIHISWPHSVSGFVLQSTEDVQGGAWVDALPEDIQQNFISVAPNSRATYYRLIRR